MRPGVWRTTKPGPVHGTWKASLRLHKGGAVQGLAVYFPEDEAIPVDAIPAEQSFTRSFIRDKELLQREQKPGVSPALTTIAYLFVGLVAILLVAALAAGVARLARMRPAREPGVRFGHRLEAHRPLPRGPSRRRDHGEATRGGRRRRRAARQAGAAPPGR
jgi:hypothetical protein